MQKKKPPVRTVQSRCGTPKIMKPSFSSLGRKNDLAANKGNENSPKTPKTQTRPTTSIAPKKSPKPKAKVLFPALPPLVSVTKDIIDRLFIKKCNICFQMCDFSENAPQIYISSKEDYLKDILSGLSDPSFKISDLIENYKVIFALIALHIYRTPKLIPAEWYSLSCYHMLSDEYHPQCFVHLSLIYDIAIALFRKRPSFNAEIAAELSGDLFKLCIYLCRTIDDREQQKLAELIVSIYLVMKSLRSFLLNVIKTAIIRVIYEEEPFTALKPILIALSSIVAGFNSPLKRKNKLIFYECVLPIHHSEYVIYFYKELITVTSQFLEKDGSLVIPLYHQLIKYWPKLQPQKQLIFIDEIAWFASYVEDYHIEKVAHIILPQLMVSLKSCHALIAEKILSMWEINDFVWLMITKPEITYPMIIPSIYEVGFSYWLLEIRVYASAVLNVLNLNNKAMFLIVGKNLKKIQNTYILNSIERGEKWRYLIINFSENDSLKKELIGELSSIYVGCDMLK